MVEKRFVIPVRRRWTLLILPILALLYFVAVIALVALGYEFEAVSTEILVLAGVAIFVIVLLIELPFLMRRKVKGEDIEDVEDDIVETTVDDGSAFAPSARAARDDEYFATTEVVQGLTVLEYSQPAKSVYRGAVYAKTLVTVGKEHALRIENLAADVSEI